MTLDEAVAHIESKFECVEGQPIAWCETGDKYVKIVSGGVKDEGEFTPLFQDEEQAVGAWLDAVMAYAADKHGTLYWRIRPNVREYPLDDEGLPAYLVYSRLVISDKPKIINDEKSS